MTPTSTWPHFFDVDPKISAVKKMNTVSRNAGKNSLNILDLQLVCLLQKQNPGNRTPARRTL